MDVDFMERNGGKRVHQRLGGGPPQQYGTGRGKVCTYWLEGRCTRKPCNFLHQKTDQSAAPAAAPASRGLVWKNPNTSGAHNGPSKWGNSYSRGASGGGGNKVQAQQAPPPSQIRKARICAFFVKGSCKYGEACKFPHGWSVGDDFTLLTALEGHQKAITGIALPSGSDKLYTSSKDTTVRVWDCQSGQCVGNINLACEIGCLVHEGAWVFVGIPQAVKAWNPQTGLDLTLNGPNGQVYALVVGNEFLFAGVQDGSILTWRAAGNNFEPVTSLSGHRLAVVSLVVGGAFMYSGSMDHTIRVWDLTTLQCLQTLTDHKDVVMSMLCWDQFLLSGSLDSTVKIWVANESGQLEVTYTHQEEHGVIALSGMHDGQSKPVLLCSCNDNNIYLYDLPSFGERGRIFSKEEVRAIQTGPGGLFFTGDGAGDLKVWKWSG